LDHLSSVLGLVGTSPAEELYVSRDLTEPGSFTKGAEGPACDLEGNLYAVNYLRQGTIGKVIAAYSWSFQREAWATGWGPWSRSHPTAAPAT